MSTVMAALVLAVLVVPLPVVAAVTTARRNCSTICGHYEVRHPFGIGTMCSLPGFSLTCAAGGADNTGQLRLGNSNITLDVAGDGGYIAPGVSISFLVNMTRGVRDYSVSWEAPGRPFFLSGSRKMSLFVLGSGVEALLFIPDSGVPVGNCYIYREEAQLKMTKGLCFGIGCCRIDIQVPLRAFTLNISRTDESAGPDQVHAFVTGQDEYRFRPSDLKSEQPLDLQAELDWVIPYQPNCERAMEERASYACVSNYSECQEFLDSPIGGYVCYCLSDGDPYVVNGCAEYGPPPQPPPPPPSPPPPPIPSPVFDFIQPKPDCPTSCGNVSIPFPFGIEPGCFAKLHLFLACMPGTVLPVLELTDRTLVTDISIDDGVLRVHEVSEPDDFLHRSGSALYALSGEWGLVKWAIDSKTCEHARLNKGDYRCFSSHSDCVDVADDRTLRHVGYRCKCSSGFEGNPYMKDGCTDTDECLQPDKYICSGICYNTFGGYACTPCPHGTDFSDVTRKCRPSTIILGVTIGLSSGVGILFLAAVAAILTRRWKRGVQKRLRKRYFRKNKGILLEQLMSSDQNASDGTKMFSLAELEKATNNFDHARVVGRGGHGTVYKGILTDQRVVAIKRSKLAASTEIDQFINEVSILSQINHRNVVKLHGCCLEAEVPLLVYEFISNGTLYDLLHCEQNGSLLPLSWEERLRIATEIAGAITYLHSAASVSILHRDIKCMNVLLNDSYTAKVSDFGASKSIPIDQTHLVTAVQGTFGYLDPEYYHTGQLNDKSDVYSFGVILVELLTRKKPIIQNEYGEKQNLSNYFLWATTLEEVVDEQIMEEAGEEAIVCMARLAEECLSLTRGERPTMKDVEMRLQFLRGRRVAPRARRDEVARPRCEAAEDNGSGGLIPATGRHGSRQYSLEQEFVSSSRVPR